MAFVLQTGLSGGKLARNHHHPKSELSARGMENYVATMM